MADVNSAPKARRKFGGYALLVAAGILLSRIAGLVREAVFGYYLGNSRAADAFKFALKMPNVLQNLMGEGVLSASFIPVYARLVAKGDEQLAGRVAGVFASLLALVVSIVVVIGVLVTPWMLLITAPGFKGETLELTVTLVRILFISVGLLVLYSWCLGILNTHKLFFISYVAPVLQNVAAIATLVIFGSRLREGDLAVALAWGMLAGAALQFVMMLPFVFRVAKQLSFGFDRRLQPVREMFRNFGPVVFGRGVVQISSYVDQMIATLLPAGAVASLSYAQMIYMLPISLFGMSVAAAELPQMASHVGTTEEVADALRKRLTRGLRQIAFFVVPTTVAFFLIGRVFVAALYQRGKFSGEVTLIVWYILIGSTVGLLVATLGRLYSSTFYALGDTRTPVRYAIARVITGAALAYLFAFPLRPLIVRAFEFAGMRIPDVAGGAAALGAVGITLASGLAAWLEYVLLRRGIRRKIGAGESLLPHFLKLWIAAIAAGIAADAFDIFAARPLTARLPLRFVIEAGLVAGLFGVIYFGVAIALHVPEARATIARFTKKR